MVVTMPLEYGIQSVRPVTPSSLGRWTLPELKARFGRPFFRPATEFFEDNAAKKHICCNWAYGYDLANLLALLPSGLEMNTKIAVYMKRMGFAAFMFFSLKGLAWIAVFYFGWQVIG